ncbi:MAG: hypothetical protein FK733_03945 [Asgard group archaeon]|nr:hypothetical protein [Asgard group archaeon]
MKRKASYALLFIVLIVSSFLVMYSVVINAALTPVDAEYIDQEDWDNWKLSSNGYNYSHSSIMIDSEGTYHLVWNEYNLLQNISKLNYCTFNGTFSDTLQFVEIYNENFTFTNISLSFEAELDSLNRLHLVYIDEKVFFRNECEYTHLIFTGGILSGTFSIPLNTPRLLKGSNGKMHVFGLSPGTGEFDGVNLYHSVFEDLTWTTPDRLTSNSDLEFAMIIDVAISKSGEMCVVFLDGIYVRSLFYDGTNWIEKIVQEFQIILHQIAMDDLGSAYMIQHRIEDFEYFSLNYSRYINNEWESYRIINLYDYSNEMGLSLPFIMDLIIIGSDIFIIMSILDTSNDSGVYLLHSINKDVWKLYPIFTNNDYYVTQPIFTANKDGSAMLLCKAFDGYYNLIACYNSEFFEYHETKAFPGITILLTLSSIVTLVPITIHSRRKERVK